MTHTTKPIVTQYTITVADLKKAEAAGRDMLAERLADVARQLDSARPLRGLGLAGLFSHTPETRRVDGICELCWGHRGFDERYESACIACDGTGRV
jgi:hypothetical protein